MAYTTRTKRQATAKAPKMLKVTYPKDGPVEELRGLQFEVPADVVDKRGWLEKRYADEVAAEASRVAERDRQKAADAEAKEGLSPEVADLKRQVGDLKKVIAELDTSQAVQISNNASESVKTMLQVYNELKQLKDSVEADRAAAQELRNETAQIKEETLTHQRQMVKVNRNFLAMMNARQKVANEQTEKAQQAAADAISKVAELNDNLAFGNGLIDDARNFRAENAELIGAMTADVVGDQLKSNESDLVAFANLVLHAAGVDREKWDHTMAQLREDPTALRYNLTRDGIRQAANDFNIAAASRTEEELAAMQQLEAEAAAVDALPHPEIQEQLPTVESLVEGDGFQMTEAQQRLAERAGEMSIPPGGVSEVKPVADLLPPPQMPTGGDES